jgi:hypothetical protein
MPKRFIPRARAYGLGDRLRLRSPQRRLAQARGAPCEARVAVPGSEGRPGESPRSAEATSSPNDAASSPNAAARSPFNDTVSCRIAVAAVGWTAVTVGRIPATIASRYRPNGATGSVGPAKAAWVDPAKAA